MRTIVESLSSPDLIGALEANMVAFWKTYGRAPGCELHEIGLYLLSTDAKD